MKKLLLLSTILLSNFALFAEENNVKTYVENSPKEQVGDAKNLPPIIQKFFDACKKRNLENIEVSVEDGMLLLLNKNTKVPTKIQIGVRPPNNLDVLIRIEIPKKILADKTKFDEFMLFLLTDLNNSFKVVGKFSTGETKTGRDLVYYNHNEIFSDNFEEDSIERFVCAHLIEGDIINNFLRIYSEKNLPIDVAYNLQYKLLYFAPTPIPFSDLQVMEAKDELYMIRFVLGDIDLKEMRVIAKEPLNAPKDVEKIDLDGTPFYKKQTENAIVYVGEKYGQKIYFHFSKNIDLKKEANKTLLFETMKQRVKSKY